MIEDYANHAANERTFLAWVRTAIAVMALGFVIEKFNLFLLTVASTLSAEATRELPLRGLSGPLGRHGGVALVYGGVALIVLATLRFVRTARLLSDTRSFPPGAARVELVLLAAMVLFVAGFSAYLARG